MRGIHLRWVTAEQAIQAVKSGDTVALGTGCSEPQTLVAEFVRQYVRFNNVTLLTMIPAGTCAYAGPGMEKHFRVLTFVPSSGLTEAIRAGRADHIPCHLSQIPRLFSEGRIRLDVALVQVSPPDDQGYCSYGISVDYARSAVEAASIVIAEVNDKMPRTCGDSLIHFSEIDFAVRSSQELLTLETPSFLNNVETSIGKNVAGLVNDGSTVQVGIGAIPAAVLRCLKDKRDLRIHTGVLTDGVIDLAERGAIAAPSHDRAPIVATLAMGSRALYSLMHENPLIEMHPCSYTHNLNTLSRCENLVCINSAFQIDLTGQVNAESVGQVQVSGVGGQLDFVRAASSSKGGKSIMVLPSTAQRGQVSRLVRRLDEGAVVTTPRSDVQYVVTEYGVADLRAKSLSERARALIAIAHPSFRDALS